MGRKLVLHVDDDFTIRTVMAIKLEHAGCSVMQYDCFADALSDTRTTTIDAVVSDFETGEQMFGVSFLAALRGKRLTVPMALFSGSSPTRLRTLFDATSTLSKHPPEVIEKPDYDAVIRWLKRVLANT